MKVTLAIPTNGKRPDQLEKTVQTWVALTPVPIDIFVTTAGDTWPQGLNDAWRKNQDSDIFICGSDDIFPENDLWLPTVKKWLEEGKSPVPLMKDARPEIGWIQGGVDTKEVRQDGAASHMTNFPVIRGDWLPAVFPLRPEEAELHYFSDNVIADKLHAIGVPTVYAKDFVIIHTADERGRGAGMGSERDRMRHDSALYAKIQPRR